MRAGRELREGRERVGKEKLPHTDPSSYALRSEEEAVICARALADAWHATPGAAE